jgi:hypothetical protein
VGKGRRCVAERQMMSGTKRMVARGGRT